jgi:hypothetical protein
MKYLYLLIVAIIFVGCFEKDDEGPTGTCSYPRDGSKQFCSELYTSKKCKSEAAGKPHYFGTKTCSKIGIECAFGSCPW